MLMETKDHLKEMEKTFPNTGVARATYVHKTIDFTMAHEITEAQKRKEYRPISCKKGCNWCCQQMVFITSDEAEILVNKLEEQHGSKIPPETINYLKQQALYGEERIDVFWTLPKEKSACVFLSENGTCSIYADRPSSCRTFQVTSHPKLCSKGASATVDRDVPVSAEIIASAALGMPGQVYGPLPKLVLQEIEKRKREQTLVEE